MQENVFETLLKEKIDNFKMSFSETSEKMFFDEQGKLIHPGEFGRYREEACKDFIKQITPSRLSVGQGFVINTYKHISHQCDIVLYDGTYSPQLVSPNNQFFFPVECVAAIGEVKSRLTKEQLKEALIKLSQNKIMREEIIHPVVVRRDSPGGYHPDSYLYDQIFTFLICKKLDFNIENLENEINEMYGSIKYRYRHNLILSIEDGLLAYYDENGKTMMYPVVKANLKNRMVIPSTNQYVHFKLFASYLFLGTSSATILYPEITDYMGEISGKFNHDEVVKNEES